MAPQECGDGGQLFSERGTTFTSLKTWGWGESGEKEMQRRRSKRKLSYPPPPPPPLPMTQVVLEMRKLPPNSFPSLLGSSSGMQRRDLVLSAESNMDLHLNAQRQRPKNVRNFQSASCKQRLPHFLARLRGCCGCEWPFSCPGLAWPAAHSLKACIFGEMKGGISPLSLLLSARLRFICDPRVGGARGGALAGLSPPPAPQPAQPP